MGPLEVYLGCGAPQQEPWAPFPGGGGTADCLHPPHSMPKKTPEPAKRILHRLIKGGKCTLYWLADLEGEQPPTPPLLGTSATAVVGGKAPFTMQIGKLIWGTNKQSSPPPHCISVGTSPASAMGKMHPSLARCSGSPQAGGGGTRAGQRTSQHCNIMTWHAMGTVSSWYASGTHEQSGLGQSVETASGTNPYPWLSALFQTAWSFTSEAQFQVAPFGSLPTGNNLEEGECFCLAKGCTTASPNPGLDMGQAYQSAYSSLGF